MADLRTLSNELLPCPFCGVDAHLAVYAKAKEQIVAECENLHCLNAVCGSITPEDVKFLREIHRKLYECQQIANERLKDGFRQDKRGAL